MFYTQTATTVESRGSTVERHRSLSETLPLHTEAQTGETKQKWLVFKGIFGSGGMEGRGIPWTQRKWLSSLPILMQESFWWWQCSDRCITSLFPNLHTPSTPPPPFSPSLSLMVSVDVKHHVYLFRGQGRGLFLKWVCVTLKAAELNWNLHLNYKNIS